MADSKLVQRAYTEILKHLTETGRAPHFTELAEKLGVQPDEARELQREAAVDGMGCWFVDETDYIESWAPFYNAPTHYLIAVDGQQKGYAQCGLEALAVRWLFPGREVRIHTRCLDCAKPITLRFQDEEILEVDPPGLVGHINVPLAKAVRGEISARLA